MLTYLAIAERYSPRWIFWENVPGVYSVNSHDAPDSRPPEIDLEGNNGPEDGEEVVVDDSYDADEDHAFACFLAGLQELGYGFAYRTLDAQYVRTCRFPFAVPQRRRRVFVVGYLGDWRRAAAVLFDRESLSGYPPPRRKAGQTASRGIEFGPSGSGFADVNPTLDTLAKDGPIRNQLAGAVLCANSGDIGYCLTASAQQSLDAETETLLAVAHSLRGEGFDASENGTGRGTPIVPVAFDCKGTEVQFVVDGSHPTLRSMGHNHSHQNAGGHAAVAIAIQERAISENALAGPDGIGVRQDGAAYTMEARTVPQAVAFDMRGREGGSQLEGPHDTANIRAASGGSSRSYVAQPWAVRRLTPTECARLQGFPDNFTLIPYRSKPAEACPDGPQYKAMGNSWAINCIDWIGERVAEVDAWE
jgi:DNA (cytosine-5)-methyltransferase 1